MPEADSLTIGAAKRTTINTATQREGALRLPPRRALTALFLKDSGVLSETFHGLPHHERNMLLLKMRLQRYKKFSTYARCKPPMHHSFTFF